jgi:hypothetical protein
VNLGPFLLEKRGQTHYEGRVVNGSKATESEGDWDTFLEALTLPVCPTSDGLKGAHVCT